MSRLIWTFHSSISQLRYITFVPYSSTSKLHLLRYAADSEICCRSSYNPDPLIDLPPLLSLSFMSPSSILTLLQYTMFASWSGWLVQCPSICILQEHILYQCWLSIFDAKTYRVLLQQRVKLKQNANVMVQPLYHLWISGGVSHSLLSINFFV